MKPRYRATLLIVGMYCVLLYFRGRFEYFSWLFLTCGLMTVYGGYGGGNKEFEKVVVWKHGVRLKSLYFYGVVVLSFLWILLNEGGI